MSRVQEQGESVVDVHSPASMNGSMSNSSDNLLESLEQTLNAAQLDLDDAGLASVIKPPTPAADAAAAATSEASAVTALAASPPHSAKPASAPALLGGEGSSAAGAGAGAGAHASARAGDDALVVLATQVVEVVDDDDDDEEEEESEEEEDEDGGSGHTSDGSAHSDRPSTPMNEEVAAAAVDEATWLSPARRFSSVSSDHGSVGGAGGGGAGNDDDDDDDDDDNGTTYMMSNLLSRMETLQKQNEQLQDENQGLAGQLRELDGDLMGMADTIERLTKQRDGAQARATAAEKERAELAAMIEQVTKDNSQALDERDKYRAELATVRRKSLERTGSSSSRGSTGDSEEKYRTQLVMAKVKLAEERTSNGVLRKRVRDLEDQLALVKGKLARWQEKAEDDGARVAHYVSVDQERTRQIKKLHQSLHEVKQELAAAKMTLDAYKSGKLKKGRRK